MSSVISTLLFRCVMCAVGRITKQQLCCSMDHFKTVFVKDLLFGRGRFWSLWWSALACLWSCPVTRHEARRHLKPTGCPAVRVSKCLNQSGSTRSPCKDPPIERAFTNYRNILFVTPSQAHMRGLSTGPFRPLSPPCSRCGRTAGCLWE